MNKRGYFITFEGGEGTGKSTQIKLLADFLEKKGVVTVLTKEPGGTEVGQDLRKILVTGEPDKMDAVAEALLYYADRRIHMTKKVWPALEQGKWVLSDRFADSTVAYQYYGYNKKIDKSILQDLYNLAVGDFKPDLTILLDIDPQIGLSRSIKKAQGMQVKELRHEGREMAFHQNLREGFLEIAKENPDRFAIFDANQEILSLHTQIADYVMKRFGLI